jgi:plastocyanin
MPVKAPSYAVICIATLLMGPGGSLSGRLTVVERGNRPARDVGAAVLWLDVPGGPRPAATTVEVITEGKEFRPRVTVVPVGSTVKFPNNDPFNHNVFSLSDEATFDLGLYGRRESRSFTFSRPGVIRIYCNVHATMGAYIVVRDNPHYTRPGADGTFTLDDVPPGRYVLHAWHERAVPAARSIEVGPRGAAVDLQLDARGYKFVQHLNKFGQPYSRGGARY